MKKIIISGIFILSIATLEAQKTGSKPVVKTPASPLKTLEDSASYAIGLSVINFYKGQGLTKLNAAMIAKAVTDIQNGKKPLLTDEQTNSSITRCMDKQQAVKSKGNIQEGETFLTQNKNKQGVITTPSGLQYEVLKQGTGPKPSATDTVTVNYKGTLLNGTEFDNSYSRGEPATFPLNRVIPGWTEGVQLMPVGSKYKFYIPYQLAYGTNATGPIPGGSLLVFEVELLSIKGK